MLKVRIVNFNKKQKKESIRHARLFFEEKIFAANVYVYIYIRYRRRIEKIDSVAWRMAS